MSKYDEKYQAYTEKMISALLGLMETKPFDSITVTELCRAAGIQRSTFYAHYPNTMELLHDAGKRVIADFRSCWHETTIEEMAFPYLAERNLMPLLSYVESHQSISLIFLREHSPDLQRQIVDWITDHMTYPHTKAVGDRVFAEYITRYYLASVRAVITAWLERGCREPREVICRAILVCLNRTALLEAMQNKNSES